MAAHVVPSTHTPQILHSRGGFKLDAWLVRHPDPAVVSAAVDVLV